MGTTDVAFSPSAFLGCLAVLIPRTRESASVIRRARTSTNVAEGDHEAGVGQHLAEHVALGAHDAAPSQQAVLTTGVGEGSPRATFHTKVAVDTTVHHT